MNWTAVTALLKTEWVRKRATNDLLLLMLVLFGGHYILNVVPKTEAARREAQVVAQKELQASIQAGTQKVEEQQTKQVERISDEFKGVRQQDVQLIQTLLKVPGAASVIKDIAERVASAGEVDGNEPPP